MFSKLQHILKDHSIITKFEDPTCAANQALFILINLYIDGFYKAIIKQDEV